MKNKILKIVLGLILFSALFITVSSAATTVKENVNDYNDIVYIIGSTRFDSNVVITAQRAANAGVNEAKRLVAMGKQDEIENLDLKTYCYNPYFDEWYELNEEARTLTKEESKNIEENLNIFFVNNKEKLLEFEYNANQEDVNILTNGVTFDGKKFCVPATKTEFKFLENNVEAIVKTKTDEQNKEELDYGNFEIEYTPSEKMIAKVGKNYYEDLTEAIANATDSTVTLLKDIDLPTAIEISTKVTLDLNNCNLTIKEDTEGWGVFHILTGGDLTINGNGIIDGTGKNIWNMVICADDGNLTINGGTYTNTNIEITDETEDPTHFDVIYVRKNSHVIINGGRFEGKTPAWLLNIKDSDRNTAVIEVKGGEFVGFDPANNKAEGEGTNFVADGYKSVEKDGVYTVVPVE